MAVLVFALVGFLIFLFIEKITLDRQLDAIPLRIAVTGTRGKSSVVRLIASVLREDGRKVWAKTTGTVPHFLLPDGAEVEIRRNRLASILEQKKLIAQAAKGKADCIVAEIMSIQPENHFVESHRLLKPQVVVLTNVRLDHLEAMGKTTNEIAAVLSLIITPQADLFLLEKEQRPIFQAAIQNLKGRLFPIKSGVAAALVETNPQLTDREFADNLDLVYGLARHFRIEENTISAGLLKTIPDVGKLKIWKYVVAKSQKTCYLVNGFAANDPESTYQLISKMKEKFLEKKISYFGLLNLRADRGDRTVQWIQALNEEKFSCLKKIFVCGAHKQVVKRKVARAIILKNHQADKLMATVFAEMDQEAVILGMGNFAGRGRRLIDYWNDIGEQHGL